MSLIRSLVSLTRPREQAATWPLISVDDYAQMLAFGQFPFALNTTMPSNREEIDSNFTGLVQGAYRANGVVFACMVARLLLFSEVRFQFQQLRGGRPGDLFGTPDLALLEQPEPGKTTGDLLARAITDADLAGNWFGVRRPGRVKRIRPDWTYMVLGSRDNADVLSTDIDADLLGFVYKPGGLYTDSEPQGLDRTEVAHFAPIPDPLASYRGMSWLTPVIREIMGDSAATLHKLKFFENAATPNLLIKFPPTMPKEDAQEWIELFEQDHRGAFNAYRTVYLGAGADATPIGTNLQQQDFKVTQGAGETRIAAAARIHPAIVGLSEGLQGASLNAGNFGAARRLVADGFLRPNWRNFAGSIQTIVPPPAGARLWYDARDVPFLAEDIKDKAEVQAQQAQSIRTLGDGGWDQQSVVDAIVSDDLSRLKPTGMLSVQLQPPGSQAAAQMVTVGAKKLRELLAEGWRAASPAEEEIIREAMSPRSATAGQVSSTGAFWPVGGPLAGYHVSPGQRFEAADPIVAAYPQFFTPAMAAGEVRCSGCHRFLAEIATPPYRLRCRDCKAITEAA